MPPFFSYSTLSSFSVGACGVSTVTATAGEAMACLLSKSVCDGSRRLFDVRPLNESGEPGDRLADDQVLHLIGAFVGIERLGVGEEARDVVIDDDAVAAEQLTRPGAGL